MTVAAFRPGPPEMEPPGCVVDPADLANHCGARIARFKVPKEFLLTDTLPRTASGKIQKHILRTWTASAGGLD